MKRIGLVAGEGGLPLVFAREAKRKGVEVIAFALKGATSPDLERYAAKVHWFEWGQLGKAVFVLMTSGLKQLTMIGKIPKKALFRDEMLDEKAKELLKDAKDKKDYSVLKGVGSFLEKLGVEVVDSVTFLEDLIPQKGTLTKSVPTEKEWEDVRFGCSVAAEMARFDIGQTVCVKEKTVLAVEAAEGTDEAIKRAGPLSGGGMVAVKVARPDQDMRFDVPLVGLDTVKALIAAKARVLAIEEKRTLFMEREESIKAAEEAGMSIVVI